MVPGLGSGVNVSLDASVQHTAAGALSPRMRCREALPEKPVHSEDPSKASLPPFFYEADQDDPMDAALLQELVALNLEVSARLNIKRLRPGEYEVEGMRVSLFWQTAELYVRARKPRKNRNSRTNLDAAADEALGSNSTPLAAYLRKLANVDTRKRESDQVDAIAVAAAFAGATGGRGLAGGRASSPGPAAALRSLSPHGSMQASHVVPMFGSGAESPSGAVSPAAPFPAMPMFGAPGAAQAMPPSAGASAVEGPGSLAGQALAAFTPRMGGEITSLAGSGAGLGKVPVPALDMSALLAAGASAASAIRAMSPGRG